MSLVSLLLAIACEESGGSADDAGTDTGGTSSGGSASGGASSGGSASVGASSGGSASGGTSSGGSASGGTSSGGTASGGSGSGETSSGGSANSTGGSGGSQSGGTAGVAGEGGATGGVAGEGGEAGIGGTPQETWCVPETELPKDGCEYPESLGGGVSPDECGVTTAAWYPLGDSEPVVWPERALGGSASGNGDGVMSGENPALLLDEDGTGFLLADCNIQRWDGDDWEPLTLPDWVSAPYACVGAIDRTGRLVLAFTIEVASAGDYPYEEMYVIRQTATEWEDLGRIKQSSSSSGEGFAEEYVLAVDSANNPFIFYAVWYNAGSSFVVRHWDGDSWSPHLGGTRWEISDIGDISVYEARLLVTPDDRPVVAGLFESGFGSQVHVVEWTGEAWNWAATADLPKDYYNDDNAQSSFTVALDSSGVPVVSWRDGSALKVLMGSAGVPTVVPATEAILETLPERVRWNAHAAESDIRVSRAEDCEWTGLSASHLGGGVSNTETASYQPSLALAGNRVCVAWSEERESDSRVFVRCHD